MTAYDDPAAVLTRLLHAIDALDWSTVRSCVADRVRVDYTELSGGEPAEVTGDELVTTWQGLLPGFDATQHLTGPVLAGEWLEAHVRGYHYLANADGGPVWAVHGHYRARLDGSARISELTLRVFYQEGNTALPGLATERARRSPRLSAG